MTISLVDLSTHSLSPLLSIFLISYNPQEILSIEGEALSSGRRISSPPPRLISNAFLLPLSPPPPHPNTHHLRQHLRSSHPHPSHLSRQHLWLQRNQRRRSRWIYMSLRPSLLFTQRFLRRNRWSLSNHQGLSITIRELHKCSRCYWNKGSEYRWNMWNKRCWHRWIYMSRWRMLF